jgi:putative transposase
MLVKEYQEKGLKRDVVLEIVGITRHQLYYESNGKHRGKEASIVTSYRNHKTKELFEVPNEKLISEIISIKQNPDLSNWYKLITYSLQVQGYYINHKKVYRLMKEYHLLEEPKKKKGRNFVKFRRVTPQGPLYVLEMDIKYVWIEGKARYAYILSIIDTFTRYILHWQVGYSMREAQVKQVWDYIIPTYLQPADMLSKEIQIEVRNDNGKQFSSTMIQAYFKTNHLGQVFTHPYTPEENGHIESFHATLGKAIKEESYKTLEDIENRLKRFYRTYNNLRQHGSTGMLSPSVFWALYEDEQITVVNLSKKRVKFKLNIAYQDVLLEPNLHRYNYPLKEV